MKNILFISIAFLFFCLPLANATIIYVQGDVSGTWSADTVIVTAEIRIPPNDTLIIEPGVKVLFQAYCKFIVDNNATLRAIGTEQDTILFDEYIPNNHWKGIRFLNADDSCRLEYCHLTHGYAIGSGGDEFGGAVYCSNSDLTVQNCLIDSCFAECDGGGIYNYYSNTTISDNTVSENSVWNDGGGLYCGYDSNPSISGNTISGNSALYGAGICCWANSNPNISGNTISENSADYGGGICCSYNSNSTINGNTISENSAYGGGGIYCNYDSYPTITCNTICGNSSYNGGGILCYSTPNIFLHNVINDNIASQSGGGIYLYSIVNITLNKCTIANNGAVSGGGIYCSSNANIVLDNCIIWENAPQQFYITSGSINAAYSDIQGTWPGLGNINANPLFADPANGDYHLTWANFPIPDSTKSPCIDTGDPNPIYNDPDGTRADMGCYYFDQPHIDDLIISIDSNDIRLQWLPIPIALIYHIYRSTEPYFDITGMNPIESTTVTYYIDTGALSGNKYYYRVTYEY